MEHLMERLKAWLNRHPAVHGFAAGVLVALALLLLAAEEFREKGAGGGAQSYYSQF